MSEFEQAYFPFRNLIETMPEFASREITKEHHIWLGRAAAAFESTSSDGNAAYGLNLTCEDVATIEHPRLRGQYANKVRSMLYREMAHAELENRRHHNEHASCLPGSFFGAPGKGHLRLSLTCPDTDLEEAPDRIARVDLAP